MASNIIQSVQASIVNVKNSILAALDEKAVGPEIASRNRIIALGALGGILVAGYLYVRQVLYLNDESNQRYKASIHVQFNSEHRQYLQDMSTKYKFKDLSKPLRMVIDFANQEGDSATIFTPERVSATPAPFGESVLVVLDKESHIEWLEKIKLSKDLTSVNHALAVVLSYAMSQSDQALIFEIDRSITRPRTGGEPSVILSIKS